MSAFVVTIVIIPLLFFTSGHNLVFKNLMSNLRDRSLDTTVTVSI